MDSPLRFESCLCAVALCLGEAEELVAGPDGARARPRAPGPAPLWLSGEAGGGMRRAAEGGRTRAGRQHGLRSMMRNLTVRFSLPLPFLWHHAAHGLRSLSDVFFLPSLPP